MAKRKEKQSTDLEKNKDRYPHSELVALSPKDLVLVLVKVQKVRHLHLPRRNVKVRVEKKYPSLPKHSKKNGHSNFPGFFAGRTD